MPQTRITGFDFARTLAVLGMFIVNFKIVLADQSLLSLDPLKSFFTLFEGRAAATFVILAGVGVGLFIKSKGMEYASPTLLKRSLFLFIGGLLYSPIWPADILHFYALYIVIGIILLRLRINLLLSSVLLIILFSVLLFIFPYEAGWDFVTFTYLDFWTVEGMIRHLFYNGFHPVIPWAAFLLFGIWLTQIDLLNRKTRIKLISVSVIVLLVTELVSVGLINLLAADPELNELIMAFVPTSPMPPNPFYMISAICSSTIVIILSIRIAITFDNTLLVKWFITTGKMALTLYVAHVILGMGVVEELGLLGTLTGLQTLIYTLGFFILSVVFSVLWLKYKKMGPIEYVMRKITG